MWSVLIWIAMACAGGTLMDGVRVLDARGDLGEHSVWIQDGHITAIDPETVPPEVVRVDLRGYTLVPGLIDAHVHITMSPGEVYRTDSPEERRVRIAAHMRGFLAAGVTSIVDPGISTSDVDLVRALQSEGAALNVYVVGPLLGPKDGYPSKVVPSLEGVSSRSQVQKQFQSFESYETFGVKVTFEDGMLMRVMPLFTPELQTVILDEAAKRQKNLYIHATDKRGIRRALQMNPHVLVHGPQRYNRRVLKDIAASGAYVISTIDIQGAGLTYFDQESFDDPFIASITPPDELADAKNPEIRKQFIDEAWRASAPGWPRWMGRLLYKKSVIGSRVKQAIRAISKLHDRNVPIVLGSDSSGWPLVPFLFHGVSTHLEMSFLQQAGLSPLDILTAGTRTPAEMLGIDDTVGTIEVGKRADLLLVKGDPLSDITLLRSPSWVISGGVVRTPQEWLSHDGTR